MNALRGPRAGATLIELLVVLAILGISAGVVGLALARMDAEPDPDAERAALVAAARREAVQTRRPVTVDVRVQERSVPLTLYPDGTVRADTALGLDPLTGRPRAEAR